MSSSRRVLVTGAGGFIGHHLVSYLKRRGYWIRGVDIKYPEYSTTDADEFQILDLRRWPNCLEATRQVDEVYALAADMGGMGFISSHHAEILHNNSLINLHTIEAARINGAQRYLYTSSACVYREYNPAGSLAPHISAWHAQSVGRSCIAARERLQYELEPACGLGLKSPTEISEQPYV
jgi:nucleoside-diphosphate-sugar epimerase